MKKVFYYFVVFFTFAVSMVSCSETMGLYEDEDSCNMKRVTPSDREMERLSEISDMYEIPISIVDNYKPLDEETFMKLTHKIQTIANEPNKGEMYVILCNGDVFIRSILDPEIVLSAPTEYITPGSCRVICDDCSANMTLYWNSTGVAYVEVNAPYYITACVISCGVGDDSLDFDGRFILHSGAGSQIYHLTGHYYFNGNPSDVTAIIPII